MTAQRLHAATTGAGPRIVLVHGFTQTGGSFSDLAAALAPSFAVVTPDLPFHGRSADIDAKNLTDAAHLVGECGGRATYVGYSLGGRVCLELALQSPELVASLVLVGATAGIADSALAAERAANDDALAERLSPEAGGPGLTLDAFLDEWLAGPLFAHLRADQQGRSARLSNTPHGLANALRALSTGRQQSRWTQLGNLSMPVAIVAGANDKKFTELAYLLAGHIGQNATVHIVHDSGHAVPFEQPRAFEELVRSMTTA